MFSRIDRVDSTLLDCISMAEDTLQHGDPKKHDLMGKPCGKPEKANPRLDRMGPPLSGTPQASSSKSVHNWTAEPTNFSDPLFDQNFDEFMESLDNLEPYDDLEDWSADIYLFMETMCHPPHMVDVLWQEAKLKKQKEIPKPRSDDYSKLEKNDPRLDRMGDPISGKNRVVTTDSPKRIQRVDVRQTLN